MVYHAIGDTRLKTISFPFDDGTNPTYYVPVTTDDLLNESDGTGLTLTDVLNYILGKTIGAEDVIVDANTDKRLDAKLSEIDTAIANIDDVIPPITDAQIDALFE